ncbi:MAG: hypothetical protein KDB68_04890 [Planctomycetes bacterium]|nr:hypothetical protein [Planctomycetota bacterium]
MNDETQPQADDIHALLAVEFDVTVDKVSRAMFAGKLIELGWLATPVANTWTIMFEPRSRTSMRNTTRQHLEMASAYSRIAVGAVEAVAHYGGDEPMAVSQTTELEPPVE